jgi:hypothetical protein
VTAEWWLFVGALALVWVALAFGPGWIKASRPSAALDQPDEPDQRRDISARACWPEVEMGNRLEREVAPDIDGSDLR